MNKLAIMTLIILLSVSFSKSQNIVWEQTHQYPFNQSLTGVSIFDNDIFAVGNNSAFGNKAQLLRLDSIGNLKWIKEMLFGGLTSSHIFNIEKVKGEPNFYISGDISSTGINFSFISKIDSVGDTLWVNTSNEQSFYDLTSSMVQLKDKSVVCAGWRFTQIGRDAVAWRVDSTGQTQWKKYYTFGSTEALDITEMMDGSLIMAGRNNGDNLLLRIGFDGRLIDTTTIPTINGSVVFQDAVTMPNNNIAVGVVSRQGTTTNIGQYLYLDTMLNAIINSPQEQGVYDGPIVLKDSTLIFNNYRSNDSLYVRNLDYGATNTNWQIAYGKVPNAIKLMETYTFDNTSLIIAGYDDTGVNQDYWLAKIDGVGEPWIPDPCAFSPPVAGFAYDFNGGIFTLLDTSYAGLPYLDTIYTWDWTLSDGFTSNLESPVTLIDTTTTKTLDIELIVSNWYGCKDTINQTLNFGPTGITSDIQFEEKLWPNPARDVLHISLSEKPGQSVLFEIFDVHGRLQKTTSFEGTEATMNISSLPQGIYFYKLSAGGVVKRGKVVKG